MDEDYITESGDIDFDKLSTAERDEYLKMLQVVESSKITLGDFEKFVTNLRISLESSLLNEPDFIYSLPFPFLKRENPNVGRIKARLQNCLVFEGFLKRPENAKAQIDQYKKRLGVR